MTTQPNQPEHKREHWGVRTLRWLGATLPAFGGLFAFALMVCLFLVAFWFITQALFNEFPSTWRYPAEQASMSPRTNNVGGVISASSRPQADQSAQITVRVLHGVELLLLAPLPLLVFLSLARYVRSFLQSDGQANCNDTLSGCGTQLHRVKTLVVALMTASVATDLLRRAIEDVSLPAAAAEGLVMLLLGSYWFALEKVCQPHCKKRASDQQ